MESTSRAVYPMRLVTRLTGLTSDTIRAWERRYRAIEPERSSGNTRQFSAGDVRRLSLLKEVTDLGHPISSVARLDVDELEALVSASVSSSGDRGARVRARGEPSQARICETYLGAVTRLDTSRSMEVLRDATERLDPHDFVFSVALPILQEVGRRWSHGDLGVAQEHVVSAQMAALLGNLVASAAPRGAPRLLLTTPPGHRHELGVLVAGILAALRNVDPVYLGPDLPWSEIEWAVQMSAPRVVVLSVVRDLGPNELDQLVGELDRLAEQVPIWLGCPATHALVGRPARARLFHSYAQFDVALRELTVQATA